MFPRLYLILPYSTKPRPKTNRKILQFLFLAANSTHNVAGNSLYTSQYFIRDCIKPHFISIRTLKNLSILKGSLVSGQDAAAWREVYVFKGLCCNTEEGCSPLHCIVETDCFRQSLSSGLRLHNSENDLPFEDRI